MTSIPLLIGVRGVLRVACGSYPMLPEENAVEITARTVAALKLPEDKDDAIFFDDDLAGFGIRLRRGPDGKVKRSYVVQYRYAGRSRRV